MKLLTLLPVTYLPSADNVYEKIYECAEILEMQRIFYRQKGYTEPWIAYFAWIENEIAGICSFKGKPQEGKIEIAYHTFKKNENKGIATEMCSELIRIALKTNSKIIITAKTSAEKNASTRVLQKNGFQFNGESEEEKKKIWEWIYPFNLRIP